MSRQWSPQQSAIFDWTRSGAGHLVVRARAGTGKTTTILEAINHAPPAAKVLLAAFNAKIGRELSSRLTRPNAEAKTLHSLGLAFIRRAWSSVTIDSDGAVDRERAVAACGGPSTPPEVVTCVRKLASLLKGVAPMGDAQRALAVGFEFDVWGDVDDDAWTCERIARAAVAARDAALTRDPSGRISFDDMVFIPVAARLARAWFDLVIVDEAQDMNAAQIELARRACKSTGRIMVVGDDRQAIYGFRGADSGSIDRLKSELAATELGLTTTYRCGSSIVAAAACIVPDYAAAPDAHAGEVAAQSYENMMRDARPGDFILSRKNAPLVGVCLRLLKAGVGARIEGRDVSAGLRAVVRSIKARTVPEFVSRVQAWKDRQIARLGKAPQEGAEGSHAAKVDAISDQAETLIAIAQGAVSVAEIGTRIDNLFTDSGDDKSPRHVVCSTVHRAKGLETDTVYVLRETFRGPVDGSGGDVEESNLVYVAITRAKRRLVWVSK